MRRKRVDSEDDLDKSRDSLSDRTPPPSIILPRHSVSKSQKKAKTSSTPNKKKTTPSRTNKVKGFLGAIELTSESEDDTKRSKSKKTPQANKKRSPAAQTINLCSDENNIVSKPATKKNNYVIEDGVVVILSSSDEEKPSSSSKILPPQVKNVDDIYRGLDAAAPEEQPSRFKYSQSSQVDTPNSATASFSPFSAPPKNIPRRVITFSDGQPPPTLQSQTSLYFSRTLASVQTSLSYKQRHLKSTESSHRNNSHTEPAQLITQRSLPPSSPPTLRSPSVQSKTQNALHDLSMLTNTPISQSHIEPVGSPSGKAVPCPIAKVANPQPEPLFLPSPTPDVVIPDPLSSADASDQTTPLAHVTSTSDDITSNDEILLFDTPLNTVACTSNIVNDSNNCTRPTTQFTQTSNNQESVKAVISTSSQMMIDISAHHDIPGIDALILTEALDDDLDGLELGYPEWPT